MASKPESITTPRRFNPAGFFVASRVPTPAPAFFLPRPACRLSHELANHSPPSVSVPLLPSLVTGHWSLVTFDLTLDDQVPPQDIECPPPLLALDIPCPTPPSPAPARPGAPRGPRDLMARSLAAVFGILHMPYGFQNSEIQNRESGNPESWCGRVGPNKRSPSKRRYPPFRSLHSIHPSNALLDPSQLQQSTSISIHHNHIPPDTS